MLGLCEFFVTMFVETAKDLTSYLWNRSMRSFNPMFLVLLTGVRQVVHFSSLNIISSKSFDPMCSRASKATPPEHFAWIEGIEVPKSSRAVFVR